jgi:hypothetical protein
MIPDGALLMYAESFALWYIIWGTGTHGTLGHGERGGGYERAARVDRLFCHLFQLAHICQGKLDRCTRGSYFPLHRVKGEKAFETVKSCVRSLGRDSTSGYKLAQICTARFGISVSCHFV